MNKIITNICLLGLSVTAAQAFNVTAVNLVDPDMTAVPVVDNTGAPIAVGAGFIGAGTFSSTPSSVLDIANFSPIGTAVGRTTFGDDDGAIPAGFFDIARNIPLPSPAEDDNPLVGQSLFLVIGDGLDLESSSNFAILDLGGVVQTDVAGAPESALSGIVLSDFLTPDNLIVGNIVTEVDTGLGLTFSEGIELTDGAAAVPEPSTSLLAGLAALGLVARRRR